MSHAAGTFLILAAFLSSASSRLMNVTIDDILGDEKNGQKPRYYPDGWTPRSAWKGTWHDRSTFVGEDPSTVSIDFNGTRIYVFFILFNDINLYMNTRLHFTLDGFSDTSKNFLHLVDPAGAKYLYNQLVFDSRDLEPGNHTLNIYSVSIGNMGSTALFDYAVYTAEVDGGPPLFATQTVDPASPASNRSASHAVSTTPSRSTPAVVPTSPQTGNGENPSHSKVATGASVAGALVAALLLVALGWIYIRQRRLRRRQEPTQVMSEEQSTDTASIEPFRAHLLQSDSVVAKRGAKEPEGKAMLAPQLSPVRSNDDSAQLRSELSWVRDELERVRRSSEPPEYTNAGRGAVVP
ncbi:hypothetical protein AURDEDRAFT_175143 [Auricularia subglabra TFB-10046 SS5]|nr:hypothetical protein AURDEDRAFT_175143 [Auricularia subglabra TFB-10046 SS5]